jgi:hypothetical protein
MRYAPTARPNLYGQRRRGNPCGCNSNHWNDIRITAVTADSPPSPCGEGSGERFNRDRTRKDRRHAKRLLRQPPLLKLNTKTKPPGERYNACYATSLAGPCHQVKGHREDTPQALCRAPYKHRGLQVRAPSRESKAFLRVLWGNNKVNGKQPDHTSEAGIIRLLQSQAVQYRAIIFRWLPARPRPGRWARGRANS